MSERSVPIFGVDLERECVILYDGTHYEVDAWYSPMAVECGKDKASVAVFQGPGGQWFAVDLRSVHVPEVVH